MSASSSRKRGKAEESGGEKSRLKNARPDPTPLRLSAEEINKLGRVRLTKLCKRASTTNHVTQWRSASSRADCNWQRALCVDQKLCECVRRYDLRTERVLSHREDIAEVKRLIAKGAPLNWQGEEDHTSNRAPLHEAIVNDSMDTVKLLIESKCDVDITDDFSRTPLHYAALGNMLASTRALVEAGADLTMLDYEGKTAEALATETAKLLATDCNGAVVEYLINDAPHIRFHPSAQDKSCQPHRIKGRSHRAIQRDLKENYIFCDHVLHRLNHFCTGKR